MDKFKALVHLVIQECVDPARMGAIRLNKILWFSDVEAYRLTGNSISGTKYLRRKKGPVPAHILRSISELSEEGKISVKEPAAQYEPRLFNSLVSADNNLFSELERDIVKSLTEQICERFTADEISELTHDEVWKAADDGEEIPLAATLVSEGGDYPAIITNWADTVVVAAA